MWAPIRPRVSAFIPFILLLLTTITVRRAKAQNSPEVSQHPASQTGGSTLSSPTRRFRSAKVVSSSETVLPRFAYVVNRSTSNISAFAVDPDSGALSVVPGAPFPTGDGPISITSDSNGRFLYVADLNSFQISAYKINLKNGALTQIGSPVHAGQNPEFLTVDPAGRFLYVLDTFFSPKENGRIKVFSIDPKTGALSPIPGALISAGVTPVSLAFAKAGRLAYVADIASNQVFGYSVNTRTGALTHLVGSPFPTFGSFPFSVATYEAASSVYVADSGSNDISVYNIDTDSILENIPGSPFSAGGTGPLSISVDTLQPFAYVANADSTNVSGFSIDPQTGALSQLAGSPFPVAGSPVAVLVDPSGKFAYVVNSDNVSVFAIGASDGILREIPGSPFPTGGVESTAITITHVSR